MDNTVDLVLEKNARDRLHPKLFHFPQLLTMVKEMLVGKAERVEKQKASAEATTAIASNEEVDVVIVVDESLKEDEPASTPSTPSANADLIKKEIKSPETISHPKTVIDRLSRSLDKSNLAAASQVDNAIQLIDQIN